MSSLTHSSLYFPTPSEEAKGMCANCVRANRSDWEACLALPEPLSLAMGTQTTPDYHC
jgi:hypothetical protein